MAPIWKRAGLSLAAFYGGVYLCPVNTFAGHAVTYPLGTRHKLPHGIANALIFPHTLDASSMAKTEKARVICCALGNPADGVEEARKAATDICAQLGLNMHLSAHGVPEADLPNMAKRRPSNPPLA